jgi:hypothetical protein
VANKKSSEFENLTSEVRSVALVMFCGEVDAKFDTLLMTSYSYEAP